MHLIPILQCALPMPWGSSPGTYPGYHSWGDFTAQGADTASSEGVLTALLPVTAQFIGQGDRTELVVKCDAPEKLSAPAGQVSMKGVETVRMDGNHMTFKAHLRTCNQHASSF